jgi:type 1 fimbria pilin
MKRLLILTAIAGLSLSAATAAPSSAPANNGNVCLQSFLIDHTHTVNPTTVLFYMRGGKIWKNTLAGACPGLAFHGFVVNAQGDEICGNAEGITVLESQEVCRLGPFTPYTPSAKTAAP